MARRSHRKIGGPDWSYVPGLPLEIVAGKLIKLSDFISFRSVCKMWRKAAAPEIYRRPQPPLLIVEHDCDRDDGVTFLRPSTRELFKPYVPELRGKSIVSSAHGWLVVRGNQSYDLSLINPLSRAQIALPPNDGFLALDFERKWCAFLSCSPSEGSDCVVMVFTCCVLKQMVAFCRIGENSWTQLDTGLSNGPRSVAYHDEMFYALDTETGLSVCDVSEPGEPVVITNSLMTPGKNQMYFFQIIDGELCFLVLEIYHHGPNVVWFHVQVLKADPDEPLEMSKVTKLPAGKALFFSDSQLFAGDVKGFDGWRDDCIYSSVYPIGCSRPIQEDAITVTGFDNIFCDMITWPEVDYRTRENMWLTPSFY